MYDNCVEEGKFEHSRCVKIIIFIVPKEFLVQFSKFFISSSVYIFDRKIIYLFVCLFLSFLVRFLFLVTLL